MRGSELEYILFDAVRRTAIGRLFGDEGGGEFSTEKYCDSFSRVISHQCGKKGEQGYPAISLELGRSHLNDCRYVISTGEDLWLLQTLEN